MTFFALYKLCNIGAWCIGAFKINAIRIILYIRLRLVSIMWIGLDLGQHLGHHCGLGWIGSQSWWIGLDLENWTHVQLWYESTISCDCDALFAGFVNRLCRNYKRQCRRANGRSSQRPKLPYWSHSRWLVVSLTLYTLSICLCRMFALWDVLGSHVTHTYIMCCFLLNEWSAT